MRILAALLCVGLAGCVHVDAARETAVHLQFANGSCSGTIIGPHAVLSATHCFSPSAERFAERVAIYGQPAAIRDSLDDGNDHTIIVLDRTFPYWATVSPKWVAAEPVFLFGNPGELTDAYRHGYVSGPQYIGGKWCVLFDLRGWFGDSGAGVFDQRGNLIAVISFIYTLDDSRGQLTMMGSYPLAFTAEQWAEVTR